MIGKDWLARPWNDVRSELDKLALNYTFKLTESYGRVRAAGELRVVRIRKIGERLEFVLARELTRSPESTP
ncbi:MAG: hypothetical protein ACYCVD_15855 [Desulfitobacteriaceae bacterium]